MDSLPQFYDPRFEIEKRTTVLPHWEQPGATYFVTFRLADSVPHSKFDIWKAERSAWLACHPEPWSVKVEREYHQRFSSAIDRWLDLGHGECVLRDPPIALVVGNALAFFENERSVQHAWVVMPNHVHCLFTVLGAWKLDQLLHSWKSFTANMINASLRRKGKLWQRDYFDRMIRDGQHFMNCIRYTRSNPTKARLHDGEYLLFESAWVKEMAPRGQGKE